MEFRLTKYIAVDVQNYEKSVAFYRDILGWELVKYTPNESQFKKGDTNFFIAQHDGTPYQTFFEYEVENIGEAKEKLFSEGCTTHHFFSEKSIMFTDPYGMSFHVYEKGIELPDL